MLLYRMAVAIFAAVLAFGLTPMAHAEPRPLQVRNGQLVITVKIDGREISALLDTGADISQIDAGLAKELGIRMRMLDGGTYGASGHKIAYGRTEKLTLDVGGWPVSRTLGFYPAGGAFAPEGVRLMIGMDALGGAVLIIDFDRMTIDIKRSSTFEAPEGDELAQSKKGWHHPTVRVSLNGADADLVIDTAASGSLHLSDKYIRDTPALRGLTGSKGRVTGIDGSHEQTMIVLPLVKLAGQTFADVRASVASLGPLARGNDGMDGVVGVALLRQFNLVIDYGRKRAWMTPNANRDVPVRKTED